MRCKEMRHASSPNPRTPRRHSSAPAGERSPCAQPRQLVYVFPIAAIFFVGIFVGVQFSSMIGVGSAAHGGDAPWEKLTHSVFPNNARLRGGAAASVAGAGVAGAASGAVLLTRVEPPPGVAAAISSQVEPPPAAVASPAAASAALAPVAAAAPAAAAAAASTCISGGCVGCSADVDLFGGDLGTARGGERHVVGQGACCAACEQTHDCWAWVFAPEDASGRTPLEKAPGMCYLKSGAVTHKPAKGLVSGKVRGRSARIPGGPADVPASGGATRESVTPDPATPAELSAVFPSAADAAAGTFDDNVSDEVKAISDQLGRKRAEKVRTAMRHMWKGYQTRAFGFDEIKPVTGTGQNNWGGMGAQLVDAIDTLWLMGMKEEFVEATKWVSEKLDFAKVTAPMSTFETTIRMLGGLLSAYDLSGEQVFLSKATDLGNRLLPAFKTPTGLPWAQITLANGATSASWTGRNSVLAEAGTVQLEMRYLSHATGDPKYRKTAEHIFDTIKLTPKQGLYPTYIDRATGMGGSSVYTMGGLADSFYEYLLKMWLQVRVHFNRISVGSRFFCLLTFSFLSSLFFVLHISLLRLAAGGQDGAEVAKDVRRSDGRDDLALAAPNEAYRHALRRPAARALLPSRDGTPRVLRRRYARTRSEDGRRWRPPVRARAARLEECERHRLHVLPGARLPCLPPPRALALALSPSFA
jgi:hypothetical protein